MIPKFVVLSKTKKKGHYYLVEGRFDKYSSAKKKAGSVRGVFKSGGGGSEKWYARVFQYNKKRDNYINYPYKGDY